MKRILFLAISLFIGSAVMAQDYTALNPDEKNRVMETINSAAANIGSMTCDFSQIKELSLMDDNITSYGKMYFNGGNRLRWEYIKPYHYTFILNGNSVLLISDDKQDKIDIGTNRIFSNIASIMMGSITGKCVQDGKEFRVSIYSSDRAYKIELTPVRKELRQIFSKINLFFDRANSIVNRVELLENTGDRTVILLENITQNKPIDEAVFNTGN